VAVAQEKKGGPYSKDEREKRQKEVFRLHFEYGYSATKIADLMKINRNTINADIKYWYSNIKEELKQNSGEFILRQIGRLEAQRTRIIENITENKIDDIKYEKLLLDIDAKINNLLLRISSDTQVKPESFEIQEDEIKDIVLFLILKYSSDHSLEKEVIISEIVNLRQCTINEAEAVFSQIKELGLECCRKFRSTKFVCDLLEFAYLRRYVSTTDTFVRNVQALYLLHTNLKAEKMRLNEKYTKEYGSKEKWTDEIIEKYDEDKNKEIEKHAETTSKIIAEALENLSNQELVVDYIKYINVFFGQEEKDRFEEYFE